jgi:dihydrofolate reductase
MSSTPRGGLHSEIDDPRSDPTMSRLIVNEFLTLDGVMQGPGYEWEDRRGGFEDGGWQQPYADEIFGKAVTEGLAEAGALLLGRRTYEIFAGFWPQQPDDDPLAPILNGLPKYVASTTLEAPLGWANSTVISGDVAEGVAKLKQQPGKDLLVFGSGDLVRTLLEGGLVDELRLMIHPLVLGGGRRLFPDGTMKTALELVDSTTTTKGVLILTYHPARTDTQG